jgi:hypothetical protein
MNLEFQSAFSSVSKKHPCRICGKRRFQEVLFQDGQFDGALRDYYLKTEGGNGRSVEINLIERY